MRRSFVKVPRGLPAVGLTLLSACAAYSPGALLAPAPTRLARQLGCLDVAVAVGGDALTPQPDPVITVELGNRCSRPVSVALDALRVRAEYPELGWRELVVYDPYAEIRPLPLDARGRGRERLEFVAPAEAQGAPAQICVDAGGIAPGEGPIDPRPLCFDLEPSGALAPPPAVRS